MTVSGTGTYRGVTKLGAKKIAICDESAFLRLQKIYKEAKTIKSSLNEFFTSIQELMIWPIKVNSTLQVFYVPGVSK